MAIASIPARSVAAGESNGILHRKDWGMTATGGMCGPGVLETRIFGFLLSRIEKAEWPEVPFTTPTKDEAWEREVTVVVWANSELDEERRKTIDRGDGIVAVLLGFGMFGAVAAAVLGWNVSLRFRLFRRRRTNPTLAPMARNWHRSRSCCGGPREKATGSKGVGFVADGLRRTRRSRCALRCQARVWSRFL